MYSLIDSISTEEIKKEYELNDIAIKFHNIIGLIIETNIHKSYLNKVMKLEFYSNLFSNNFDAFKENLFVLLEENDYLWSKDIKQSWEKILNGTYSELSKKNRLTKHSSFGQPF